MWQFCDKSSEVLVDHMFEPMFAILLQKLPITFFLQRRKNTEEDGTVCYTEKRYVWLRLNP